MPETGNNHQGHILLIRSGEARYFRNERKGNQRVWNELGRMGIMGDLLGAGASELLIRNFHEQLQEKLNPQPGAQVLMDTPRFILLPQGQKDLIKKALEKNLCLPPHHLVYRAELEPNLILGAAVPPVFKEYIERDWNGYYAHLMEWVYRSFKSIKGIGVFAAPGVAYLVAGTGSKVLACNRFILGAREDLLYYVLHMARQCHIDPQNDSLELWGPAFTEDTYRSQFIPYWEQISMDTQFLPAPGLIQPA